MLGPDLSFNFRLFGIPIQVSLFFVLMAVLLSQGFARGSPVMLAVWVVVIFLSVLFHELGHAFTARAFGHQPYISFIALGGVTAWREKGEMTPGRRLLVSFAGPAAGLALGVAVLVLGGLFTTKGSAARNTAALIALVNGFWAVINLIPMLPLDGGKIMAAVFDLVTPGRGRRASRYISIATAVGVGAYALAMGYFLLALVCALSIWMNISDLRAQAQMAGPPPPGRVGGQFSQEAPPPASGVPPEQP